MPSVPSVRRVLFAVFFLSGLAACSMNGLPSDLREGQARVDGDTDASVDAAPSTHADASTPAANDAAHGVDAGAADSAVPDAGLVVDAGLRADAGVPDAASAWFQPGTGATWQWQLLGIPNTSYDVDVYDLDLFDVAISVIDALHARGKKVVCYFSAGSYEDWRPDASSFPSAVLGSSLDGWPDERWLDIRSQSVRDIMAARLDLAVSKGCDAVEPDNVDGFANATGFGLASSDQLSFNEYLSQAAHTRGLGVGLKNDLDQIPELVHAFDFAVNEQCHEYDECDALTPFVMANKAVFQAEYDMRYVNDAQARAAMCAASLAMDLRTLILPLELNDGFRLTCDP